MQSYLIAHSLFENRVAVNVLYLLINMPAHGHLVDSTKLVKVLSPVLTVADAQNNANIIVQHIHVLQS